MYITLAHTRVSRCSYALAYQTCRTYDTKTEKKKKKETRNVLYRHIGWCVNDVNFRYIFLLTFSSFFLFLFLSNLNETGWRRTKKIQMKEREREIDRGTRNEVKRKTNFSTCKCVRNIELNLPKTIRNF